MQSGTGNKRQLSSRAHILALDGVRGLAILLVLVKHFLPWGQWQFSWAALGTGAGAYQLITRLPRCAWVGVDLFFVLSGFLITGILWDAKGTQNYFGRFYMRRFLRIFPLYYGILIALLVIAPLFVHFQSAEAQFVLKHQIPLWLYTANWSMAWHGQWFYGSGPMEFNHFWSLCVEEQFYLVWPFAVYFISSRRTLLAMCGVATIVALALRAWFVFHGASWTAIFVFTPCRIDTLAAGAALALLVRGPGGLAVLLPWARRGLLICGALLIAIVVHSAAFCLDQRDTGMQLIGYTLLAGFFASTLTLAIGAPAGTRTAGFWTHPVLRFLGKYSYGIYVFHEVCRPIYDRVFPLEKLQRLLHGHLQADIAFFILASTCSVAIAVVSFHVYESPFLKLKRFFEYRRPAPGPATIEVPPTGIPVTQAYQ
jgi:peptidoglycan/LPS O-acetylase OafA/YrhL